MAGVSLTTYVLRRLLSSIIVLFAVTLVTFLLLHAASAGFAPGLQINPNLRPEDVARIRRNLGLDDALWLQYARWLVGLLHGDFGQSLLDGSPVIDQIMVRLPNTLLLTVTGIAVALLIAIPMGAIGALRRGSRIDAALTLVSVAGVSIPAFWLGLLLILLFSVTLRSAGLPWLPSSGAVTPIGGGDVGDRLAHLLMPALCLAFGYIAVWSRFTRSSMLDVLSQDYVRTARAKGLGERRITYVHALRNAIVPLVTLIGLELPGVVGGSAIVEIVFNWPGIGRLALDRALQYDLTVVLGLTTFTAILVVVGNLLADLAYAVLDPRIRQP